MSKRRNRKKSNRPNIPQSTLDRARIQAGLEPEGDEDTALAEGAGVEEMPESSVEEAPIKATRTEPPARTESTATDKPKPRPTRRRISDAQLQRSKERGKLDAETVAELLHNPTKVVSEEELHRDYGYVLSDLRNMGILAGVLMIFLVVLAQFI